MVMTSDETQIQIFANWPMSHAKRVTRDNRKNPEYHVVAAIRKLRTDKNCPAGRRTRLSGPHLFVLLAGLAFTDFCTALLSQPFYAVYKLADITGNIKLVCIAGALTESVGLYFCFA